MSEEEIMRIITNMKIVNGKIQNETPIDVGMAIGGILNLYNKEKEKNKYYQEELKATIEQSVPKYKIREFIEKNTKYISFGEQDTYLQGQRDENDEIMDRLQELLEERN